MWQGQLIEQSKLEIVAYPQNISGTALTGPWVSFANFRKAQVVFCTGAWAGATSAVTLNQAKDSSGTGSKALAFTTMYSWSPGSGGTTTDKPASNAVSSNTFNLSAADTFYVVELNAYDLDISNNFLWLQVATASPGSNADYLSAWLYLYQTGISAKFSDVPSALS